MVKKDISWKQFESSQQTVSIDFTFSFNLQLTRDLLRTKLN